MNKRFLALAMTVLLILTGAGPASAAVEEIPIELAAGEEARAAEEAAPEAASEETAPGETTAEETSEETAAGGETAAGEISVGEPAAEAAEEISEALANPEESSETLPEDKLEEIMLPELPVAEEEPAEETEEEEIVETEKEPEPVGAFSFTPKDPKDGGTYVIHSAKNGNFVLDIYGCMYRNGIQIQLYTQNKTDAQKFLFTKVSDGAE